MTTLHANCAPDLCPRPSRNTLNILGQYWGRLQTRARQKSNRAAFKELLTLSPHLLKDIGVSHEDVRWAANLPIEQDAAKELERLARIDPMIL